MTDLSTIKLFATHPHDCSYLADKKATTLFVDPDLEISQELYSSLSELGFRRSGEHLYRPKCQTCNACIPTRLPAQDFAPNRSQRRCLKKNRDIDIRISKDLDVERYYPLYERYINTRHSDGDMYPPSRDQFTSFLVSAWNVTEYAEFWLDDNLVGVAVMDRLQRDLTAVYTFFDPDQTDRSLGVFAILWQLRYALEQNLDSVYLGYWIRDCDKMNYKLQYRPIQLLTERRWVTLS